MFCKLRAAARKGGKTEGFVRVPFGNFGKMKAICIVGS